MDRAKIIGSGVYMPPFVVDNARLAEIFPRGPFPEWSQNFNWDQKWIEEKLGITERRYAFDFDNGVMREGYYDLDLGERAAREAVKNAGISVEDIDTIIYITSTPEEYMPDPACNLHFRLAAREDTAAIGLTSVGCGGFIYGMNIANALIASGTTETILLVGSTSTSSYGSCYSDPGLDAKQKLFLMVRDRINASIFGDGAGALILHRAPSLSKEGIIATYWGASGIDNPVIYEAGGSRKPATTETVKSGLHFFNLNVHSVKVNGPVLFIKAVQKLLKKCGLAVGDIDFFVFHQVNLRLLRYLALRLEIPWEKMSVHVDRYGNLDTAAIAVGFHEAKEAGKIKDGDLVLFAAIGAGWQYGSVLIRI